MGALVFCKRREMSPHQRADGQETLYRLTLLPRLEGGRGEDAKIQIKADAGSRDRPEAP
jgi:hypothetical protein